MATHHHVLAFDRPLQGVQLTRGAATQHTPAELAAARDKGYHDGEAAARAFFDQQMVEMRTEVRELQDGILKRLDQAQSELEDQVRQALIDLTIEVGGRMLAGFTPPPEMVERLCEEALEQLYPETEGLELQVSPRDAEILDKVSTDWGTRFPGLRLTIMDHFQPGDCVVRSRFGITDARRSEKLNSLRRELTPA
jgi:flagellar assembly protein FliH